ncbi:mechanosensitive ion channel family protein [Halosolutus gelatinilyticus]|uniref:mechanosensitive ion channel family protein n=1 Tax=Halosolutus gelatinilyticus TaxID=2931975 RepID=UPI001FF3033D|nr:mechanosensitive ion channel family protein [Halosolutus gelatinilyticus]
MFDALTSDPTALDKLETIFNTLQLKLAVTFAAVGFLLIVLLSYRQLQDWLNERTQPLYSDIVTMTVLVGSGLLSLSVTLGTWGLTSDLQNISSQFGFGGETITRVVVTFILLVATFIVTRFARRLLKELLGSAAVVTDHQREVTHRITQVIIWSVSLVVILSVWVEDLSGLLVGAGFLGIVVGMAARQTLGTVIAGFVLMFDRPFEIGDWIAVEDDEGVVTDISIVNTRLKTFDGEYVMIPNDVISSSMVTNRSKRGRLRIEVEVGVDYATDVERASDLAKEAVSEIDRILDAPSPQVVGKAFGDSAVILGVRFWIDRPSGRRRWRARTEAINAIKRTFEDEGIKIPYPQRELSGRAETGGFQIADDRARGATDGTRDASDRGESEDRRVSPPEGE